MLETLETRRHFAFGTVLTAFGTGGSSSAPTLGNVSDYHTEAFTLSDGKTVVAVGGGMTRFNANGALDTTFGTDGITQFRRVSLIDAAPDSSGRIYALVKSASGTLVQRFQANGRLDSAYGTSGSTLVADDQKFLPEAIAVQGDGKVVVAGIYGGTAFASTVTRVYRLTAGAALDSGFGSSGKAEFTMAVSDLTLPYANDEVADLRVLGSGKILVLGTSYNSDTGLGGSYGDSVATLARLNSGGTLDSSFGSGGVARRATFDDISVENTAGTIRADGSAVVASTEFGGPFRTSFVGFSASGKTAFNTYALAAGGANSASDATALPDGRVAFVNRGGKTWLVTADGVISNVLQPNAGGDRTNAIVATSGGDLILADVNNPYVRVTEIDAGKIGDARPDNLPAASVIDTAADGNGGLHVAFFDTASKSLKYDYRNAQGYWSGVRSIDLGAGAGAAISIDTFINSKGRTQVAVAYYDANAGDLKLATSSTNGRKWATQTVATKGLVGISPSLHFTDAGGYAVTYYSKTAKSLYYSINNTGTWTTETVATGGSGEWSEMQFDPETRRPAVAFSGPKNTVMYALRDRKTGWGSTTLATTSAGVAFVNLALPNYAGFGPRVSYYDLANADLMYVGYQRNAKPRLTPQIVASRGIVGAYNDIVGHDYNNTLYAYSRNGDSVFSYAYDSTDGNAVPTTVVTGGGRNLSVATSKYDDSTVVAIAYTDTATGLTFVR